MRQLFKLINKLGPGMLYAGTAVGVSHLVQSTRAGGLYGEQLIWAILIANFLKYPFFEIGPKYAALTGQSLIDGYYKLHPLALTSFVLLTLCTMFTTLSSITLVTSGIAQYLLNTEIAISYICISILLISFSLIFFGGFHLLNESVKYIVLTLSLCTIASSFILVFKNTPIPQDLDMQRIFSLSRQSDIFFLIALMGWMPAPLELSVWHSIWETEKLEQEPSTSVKSILIDFKIGYFFTMFLAILFVFLGAKLMYGTHKSFPDHPVGFAKVLLELYTSTIGDWAFPIVAVAALSAMLSTTLTCLDAFPKVLIKATKLFSSQFTKTEASSEKKVHGLLLMFTVFGTLIFLVVFSTNMKSLVDFTTIIAFITAPFIALMNYLSMKDLSKKKNIQISPAFHMLSFAGMTYLVCFSIFFIFNMA